MSVQWIVDEMCNAMLKILTRAASGLILEHKSWHSGPEGGQFGEYVNLSPIMKWTSSRSKYWYRENGMFVNGTHTRNIRYIGAS
jgi:hypothetical protein